MVWLGFMDTTVAWLDSAFVATFGAGDVDHHPSEATLPHNRSAIVFLLLPLSKAVAAVP